MMERYLLVCVGCKKAVFLDSTAHTAPKWQGQVDYSLHDSLDGYREIGGQDDLHAFKFKHLGGIHEVIKVKLESDFEHV